MSGDSTVINEIVQMLSSPDNIQSDIAEAFGLVREHLHNKYTGKMMEAIDTYKSDQSKNPSAEVRLLKAFKPFMEESSHQRIDELAETISAINVFREMSGRFGSMAPGGADVRLRAQSVGAPCSENNPSVRPDGVYDIDEQCLFNSYGRTIPTGARGMAGIIMLMSIMGKM